MTAASRPAAGDDREFLRAIAAETGLGPCTEPLSEDKVARMLAGYFGLSGTLKRIPTEKDDTFLLATGEKDFLVKISPPGEDPEIVNLQTSAMLHIRDRAPSLPVQRPVAGAGGAYEFRVGAPGGAQRALRVLTFLPGRLLSNAEPTLTQARGIGAMLARLSMALNDFTHRRQDRLLIWDLQRFHRMRPLIDHAGDSVSTSLARQIFDAFDERVRPVLPLLAKQVVHGDFSRYNVLVDDAVPGYVCGVIDFGDVVRTAVVFDIAVGMANLLCAGPGDPWVHALKFLDGYLAVRPVPDHELAVLAVSVQARLLLRALMARWRAIENPSRRDYLLSHSEQDWAHLGLAQTVPEREITERIRALAGRRLELSHLAQEGER